MVNYDFPSFVSDYIHRAGRVGRVGSSHSGRVTSFVAHKWEVEVLWQIEVRVTFLLSQWPGHQLCGCHDGRVTSFVAVMMVGSPALWLS